MDTSNHHQQQFTEYFRKKRYQLRTVKGSGHEIAMLDIGEISYLEADASSTNFIMSNGEKKVSSDNLGHHEDCMAKNLMPFYRIHNCFIVNLFMVDRILKGASPKVVLKAESGERIVLPISEKYRKRFFDVLGIKQGAGS